MAVEDRSDPGDSDALITATMIPLTGELPDHHQLLRPMWVSIQNDGDEVVVSESKFFMHASAPNETQALIAFRETIVGYLALLSEREATLGTHLRSQLEYLRSIIAPN